MRKASLAGILLVVFASPVNAGPLTISDIVGGWANPVGGQSVLSNRAGQLTDEIRWGNMLLDPVFSGYDFTPGADLQVAAGRVRLGSFAFLNFGIEPGSEISSVDYVLQFSVNGAPGFLTLPLHFLHTETDNIPDRCLPGSVTDCDDVVGIVVPAGGTLITVGAEQYLFALRGLSADGGRTFRSQYMVREDASSTADLYGEVTPVPEPATIALVGAGIAAMLARRRARRDGPIAR